MAGIAIMSQTELLLVVLAATAVAEVLSDIIQITSFKLTHKRVFKMAPFHTHFEQAGWHETTVLTRFWIASGLSVAFGLGVFYAEFISHGLK
jgi:phospho-N-acetylmuramoyl-pentapeptide-transferase